MELVENITGVGCIARDSVQVIGEDVWFLSSSGLRSLGRTVVKDKMPLSDISRNIRSFLIQNVINIANKDTIKSVYNEKQGFYLLSIPTSSIVFVFDVRAPLQDGSVRISTWDQNIPTAFVNGDEDELYFGESGAIGRYTEYQDNGSSYDFSYKSGWLSFEEQGTRYVIPKKIKAIVYTGTNNSITFGWRFDFATSGFSVTNSITGVTPSEWGEAEWGLGEWSGGGTLTKVSSPMKGHGNLIRIDMDATINGYLLAIQRVDVHAKLGRIN